MLSTRWVIWGSELLNRLEAFDLQLYELLLVLPELVIFQKQDEKVIFKTTFTNTTQREQEYSFKTERATRSSSTVIIEKGVCRGAEVSLKLKTPCEVVEANAGFTTEVMLNHIGENTSEEELTWGVDSCVKVPPAAETVAELVIIEDVVSWLEQRDHQIVNRLKSVRKVGKLSWRDLNKFLHPHIIISILQVTREFRIENRLSGKVLVTSEWPSLPFFMQILESPWLTLTTRLVTLISGRGHSQFDTTWGKSWTTTQQNSRFFQ